MKKRTFIITIAAIIVAVLVLFTFTVARADHVGGSGPWERIYWHYIDKE